jgi:hypothetical protein
MEPEPGGELLQRIKECERALKVLQDFFLNHQHVIEKRGPDLWETAKPALVEGRGGRVMSGHELMKRWTGLLLVAAIQTMAVNSASASYWWHLGRSGQQETCYGPAGILLSSPGAAYDFLVRYAPRKDPKIIDKPEFDMVIVQVSGEGSDPYRHSVLSNPEGLPSSRRED